MTASTTQSTSKNSLFYRTIRYYFGSIYPRLKHDEHDERMKQWAHHSDNRRFDWKWEETNYNRIAVINLLLSKQSNPTYLEIGCESNSSFDSVPVLNKIGVDPAKGGTMRMTSDEFFKQNNGHYDVVFIDGLHTYEQVRNDVANAIRFLNKGGWVVLHDMLPRDWIEHHVPIVARKGGAWTGDVWKVGFELSQTAGIDFKILIIDHGVGVFRVTRENIALKDMTNELRDKEFSYFYDNIKSLPLIEWNNAQQWLRS
jgi:Methyltransferase domain